MDKFTRWIIPTLYEYVNEIAYHEDTHRLSNGTIFHDAVSKYLNNLPSDDWRGYWQGNKKHMETLAALFW